MEPGNTKDYAQTRAEIVRVQDCITEYMKMYFGVGVLVIGAVVFIYSERRDFNLSHTVIGASVLALNYIVLAFSTIIFHKCNTHNRYAGYARALERERWSIHKSDSSPKPRTFRLWETSLGRLYGQPMDPLDEDSLENELKPAIKRVDDTYDPKIVGYWVELQKGVLTGLLMMFRATIQRYPTKSWTYPYQVAFPMFVSTAILFGIWFWTMQDAVRDYEQMTAIERQDFVLSVFVQLLLVVHISMSWCGLAFRLYRLSDDAGDRTIDAYTKRFILTRHKLLKQMDVDATYLGVPDVSP